MFAAGWTSHLSLALTNATVKLHDFKCSFDVVDLEITDKSLQSVANLPDPTQYE